MWRCRVQHQSTSEGNSVKCNFPTLDFTEIAWYLNMYENVQKMSFTWYSKAETQF